MYTASRLKQPICNYNFLKHLKRNKIDYLLENIYPIYLAEVLTIKRDEKMKKYSAFMKNRLPLAPLFFRALQKHPFAFCPTARPGVKGQ